MRAVALACLTIIACACLPATPPPVASPSPDTNAGIGGVAGGTVWTYDRALFLPPDPNTYSDLIYDAQPLADGGWLVLHAPTARPRFNCDPLSYGCGLVRQPIAVLQRVDANGRVIAQEHGSEPFALTRLHVFEGLNVVVGEGPQVVNGTLHAFRLDTLDGIASELGQGCVAADDRCFSFRTDYTNGTMTIAERDARDLRLISSTTQTIASVGPLAVFRKANLVTWRAATDAAPFVRSLPLDASRPAVASWSSLVASACDVARVADDRAVVTFGPSGCRGDAGWRTELVEVSTGRTLRALAPDEGFDAWAIQHGELEAASTGLVIDPRDGSDGPTVTAQLLHVDWPRGLATVWLGDGGVAVLRRESGSSAPRDVPFRTIATASCAEYEFPRIMAAEPSAVRCAALAGSAGASRLLVATGRAAYAPSAFTITRATVDTVARTIELKIARNGSRSNITDASPTAIVEFVDALSGEWLVRLAGDSPFSTPSFVVRL